MAALLVLVVTGAPAATPPVEWYVATTGDDAGSCTTPEAPCATVAAAVAKASAHDVVNVAAGRYTATSEAVVVLGKPLRLAGGWDAAFAVQDGMSTIDGESARRGLRIVGTVVRIERFVVENGISGGTGAGGIHIAGITCGDSYCPAGLVLERSIVRDNAGGIWSDGLLAITNSTISGNTSLADGVAGGITAYGRATAAIPTNLKLTNSTISGNSGPRAGGVLLDAPDGRARARLANVTIARNAGSGGAGVLVGARGDLALRNSIVAENETDREEWDTGNIWTETGGTVVSEGHNLGTGFTATTGDVETWYADLDDLADNGGPTETHLVFAGAAVDGGDPAGCRDADGAGLQRDQRGLPREVRCDIGAYEVPRPENDDFDAALPLDGLTSPVETSSLAATKQQEPGFDDWREPDHGGEAGGTSVWYAWTSGLTGWASVDTDGSSFDTLLAVYVGDYLYTLTPVAANDEGGGWGTSRVCFPVTAGTTYRIAVDGYDGASGDVVLNWAAAEEGSGGVPGGGDDWEAEEVPGPCSPPPANDDFAAATTLDALASPLLAWNRGATRERGEPTRTWVDEGGSVWFTWTPGFSGPAVVDTYGSAFDTDLGVFAGGTVTALTEVAANDDAHLDATSRAVFTAAKGETYRIAVDGRYGHTGDVRLAWGAAQGCGAGFWKNHLRAWAPTGLAPAHTLGSVLDPAVLGPLATRTLLDALRFTGGASLTQKQQTLLRGGVGALLNSAHPLVLYPQTTSAVRAQLETALGSGDPVAASTLQATFAELANLACPLGGPK